MPNFDTPEPISATIDLAVGDVRIARERPGRHGRRRAPERRVQRAGRPGRRADPRRVRRGRLLVKGAEAARARSVRQPGSIDVTVELPAGSQSARRRGSADSTAPAASASAGSRPGSATSSSTGPAALKLKTGGGDIGVERATGPPRSPPARARCGSARSTAARWSRTPTATLGRRGQRRPAGERGQRQHRRRPCATPASPPRPPTATSASARSSAARPCSRPASATSRSASARAPPPGSTCTPASAACTTTSTPPTAPTRPTDTVEVRAPHLLRRHRDPPLRSRLTLEGGSDDDHDRHPDRHRGDRAAQVVRRQGRARRHRPRRRRGNDLLAARPQRRRARPPSCRSSRR